MTYNTLNVPVRCPIFEGPCNRLYNQRHRIAMLYDAISRILAPQLHAPNHCRRQTPCPSTRFSLGFRACERSLRVRAFVPFRSGETIRSKNRGATTRMRMHFLDRFLFVYASFGLEKAGCWLSSYCPVFSSTDSDFISASSANITGTFYQFVSFHMGIIFEQRLLRVLTCSRYAHWPRFTPNCFFACFKKLKYCAVRALPPLRVQHENSLLKPVSWCCFQSFRYEFIEKCV